MNTKKRTIVHRLLSGTLVLLGFTSCSEEFGKGDDILLEYGSPHANFQVKGKVASQADELLKNIQVIVRQSWNNDPEPADTVYTDEKGEFQVKNLGTGSINKQKVYFHDIDGEENGGAFKSDSISLEDMDMKQLEEGGRWYAGKFEFSTKDAVKLEKEEKKSEE